MMHPAVLEALEEVTAQAVRNMPDQQLQDQLRAVEIYINALRQEIDRRRQTLIADVAGHA